MSEFDANFKPQSEADRHRASYEPVPGSQRSNGGNYTKTRQRVSVVGGESITDLNSLLGEILLELRAIRRGMEFLTENDLIQQADS